MAYRCMRQLSVPEPTSLRYGKMLGMRSTVVVLGGAIGALARWGIDEFVVAEGLSFPLATFAVNISGAFLLGIAGLFVEWAAFSCYSPSFRSSNCIS